MKLMNRPLSCWLLLLAVLCCVSCDGLPINSVNDQSTDEKVLEAAVTTETEPSVSAGKHQLSNTLPKPGSTADALHEDTSNNNKTPSNVPNGNGQTDTERTSSSKTPNAAENPNKTDALANDPVVASVADDGKSYVNKLDQSDNTLEGNPTLDKFPITNNDKKNYEQTKIPSKNPETVEEIGHQLPIIKDPADNTSLGDKSSHESDAEKDLSQNTARIEKSRNETPDTKKTNDEDQADNTSLDDKSSPESDAEKDLSQNTARIEKSRNETPNTKETNYKDQDDNTSIDDKSFHENDGDSKQEGTKHVGDLAPNDNNHDFEKDLKGEGGHAFTFFILILLTCALGYIFYQNRRKISAYVVRGGDKRRTTGSRRGNGYEYQKVGSEEKGFTNNYIF